MCDLVSLTQYCKPLSFFKNILLWQDDDDKDCRECVQLQRDYHLLKASMSVLVAQATGTLKKTSSTNVFAHLPGGGTFLSEMTSWPPSWTCGVKSKIRLPQLIRKLSLLTWRTAWTELLNFLPIQFQSTEPWAVFQEVDRIARRTTRWVAIWDQ